MGILKRATFNVLVWLARPRYLAHAVAMDPIFVQTTGLVYSDGGEQDSVVVAGGAAPTLDTDKEYLARLEVEETSNNNGNFTAQFQYRHTEGTDVWTDVTTSTSVVKAIIPSTVRDGLTTTDRISSSGRTFLAGVCSVDGLAVNIVVKNEQTEIVFPFEIISGDVSDADEVLLRVRNTHADGDPTWTQNIDITVNIPTGSLPGLVANAQSFVSPETVGWFGPYVDGDGVLWYIGEVGIELAGTEPDPVLRNSTDGGETWHLIDMVNEPGIKLRDMEAFQINRSRIGPDTVGDVWVAVCRGSAFDLKFLRFFSADHASTPNTWSTAATDDADGTAGGDEQFVAFAERSDGDIIALYGQTISTFTRVVARQQAAGTFSAEFNVDTGTASTHYSQGVLSLGASDRVLVAYHDRTNASIDARDIPDNSTTPGTVASGIEGAQTVKAYSAGAMSQAIVDALQFDADDKHLVIWLDNSDKLWSVVMTWSGSAYTAGTPEQVSTTSVESDFPTTYDITGVNAQMAVDYATGDVYCMFIDAANRDIYRVKWTEGGGWETEVKVFTATGNTDRAAYVMPNVFTHASGNGGKKVLGWVWTVTDTYGPAAVDGQVRYDEFEIPTGAAIIKVENESVGMTEGDIRTLEIVRQEDESEGIAEGDIRALGIVRLEAESLGIAEGDIKVVGLLHQEDEAVGLTETDLSLIGLVKVEDESVGITEGDLHVIGLVRVANESVGIAEGDITVLSLVRIEDESVDIAEGDIKVRAIVRQEDEAAGITEGDIKVVGLLRQEDESIGLTEEDLHLIGLVKVEDEALGIIEADLHLIGLVKIEDESVGVTEGDLRIISLLRIENESVGITEGDLRLVGLLRQEDESVGVTEAELRVISLLRQEDESIGLTESDLHLIGLVKVEDESVGITEDDLHLIGLVKVEDESVGITETDIRVRGLVRLVDETIDVAEGELRFMSIVKIENESINIAEQDLTFRDLVRVENEIMGIAEEAIRARGLVRVEAEGITLSEQDIRNLGLVRLVNEPLAITEVDIKVVDVSGAAAVVFSRITLKGRQDKSFKGQRSSDF